MAETRTPNDYYREVAEKLMKSEPELAYIAESGARIVFLSSDLERKGGTKTVFGCCEKVADKYKWGIPYDFTITIYEPNVELFSEEQLRILLFHELLHVGAAENKDGGYSFSCRPHDLEDFKLIIDKFGTDWAEV